MQTRLKEETERRPYVVEVTGRRNVVTVEASTWGEALHHALAVLGRASIEGRIVCDVLPSGRVYGHDPDTGDRFAVYGDGTQTPTTGTLSRERPLDLTPTPAPATSRVASAVVPFAIGGLFGMLMVAMIIASGWRRPGGNAPAALREAAAISNLTDGQFVTWAGLSAANRSTDRR